MQTNPDNPLQLAIERYKSGDLDQTEQHLSRLLAVEPSNVEALNLFGLVKFRQGDQQTAVNTLEKAIGISPQATYVALNLAYVYKEKADYPAAFTYACRFLLGSSPAQDDKAIGENITRVANIILNGQGNLDSNQIDSIRIIGHALPLIMSHADIEGVMPSLLKLLAPLLATNTPKQLYVQFTSLLGFLKSSGKNWNAMIFSGLVLPLLKLSLEQHNYEIALTLEGIIHAEYIKVEETEDHFLAVTSQYAHLLEQYGEAFGKTLDPLPVPPPKQPYNMGFFVHRASFLAHIEMMTNVLEGINRLAEKQINATVIIVSGRDNTLHERLSNAGVNIIYLDDYKQQTGGSTLVNLLLTRRISIELGFHAIAWVSTSLYLPFAFAAKMAPVQIWWSMKYHTLNIKHIDGYVTCGSLEQKKTIFNREWRTAFIGIDNWYDPTLEDAAKKRRAELGQDKIILGSFGREEKLSDPEFVETVCRILEKNPDCLFLWTGNNKLRAIDEHFRKRNVVDQTVFIGWVNTKLYAQVIDIFVDSFPFPCGFTLYQSMAAGVPPVFYKSPESFQVGANGVILPIIESDDKDNELVKTTRDIFIDTKEGNLFLSADTIEQYLEYTQRLIDDPAYRKTVGDAGKRFVDSILSNKEYMGKVYQGHFVETIEENYGDG